MTDLIKRLKNATGPDRELDVAIAFAVGRVRERDGNYLYATGNDSDMVVEPNEYDDHIVAQPLSYYTSSLDAALTLLPDPGWDYGVSHMAGWGWQATIKAPDLQQWSSGPKQKTGALALCIVALKTREST